MKRLTVVQKQLFIVLGLVTAIALMLSGLKGFGEKKSAGVFALLGQPLLVYPLEQLKEEKHLSGRPGKVNADSRGYTSASGLPQGSHPDMLLYYR